MKQILFLSVLLILLLGCNTTKQAAKNMDQMDLASQKKLKGDWQIRDVTFPDRQYYKFKVFQIADASCLVGSQWSFVPNNNTGSMNLTKSDCPQFSSSIVWSINKNGIFSLKFVDSGTKAKKVTQGFKLRIANQTNDSFQLVDEVNVEGSQKELIFQFQKQ